MTPLFPFSALVALDELQLALQLAAIDRRLSVLLRGDKGAGKSTAARGLGELLGADAPFVNLPIGATEDRILGGLDIERALTGEPALKPGLLAQAHGGVLYIDEVNLLPDHLADAMLDVVASGTHVVEREGFSARQDADFVLVGSMNPEEGSLRPQLLDRFALVVDVAAPLDPSSRRAVVERRLAFDADAVSFVARWQVEQQRYAQAVARARHTLTGVVVGSDLLDVVSQHVCAHGVRSMRTDLAIVRASRALAALEGAEAVTSAHVERVLPMALRHRVNRSTAPLPPSPPPGPRTPSPSSGPDDGRGAGDDDRDGTAAPPPEHVFASAAVSAPRIVAGGSDAAPGTAPANRGPLTRGPAIGARSAADPRELHVRATIVQAIGQSGSIRPRREDLHEIVRAPAGGRRYLFVIDASGSLAAQQRMRLVKGAVDGLLGSSVRRADDVAIVSFRGAAADIALPPTSDVEAARQALRYLPTGGRTPLAHALEMAAGFVTDDTVLVLLTDGRANVPTRTDDPWIDALDAASRVACPALVIDSDSGPRATGRGRELAGRMGATHVPLEGLDQHILVDLVRSRTRRDEEMQPWR